MFFTPIQQLSQVFDGYQQARVGLSRIAELLRTPTTVPPEPGEPVPVPARLRGEVELRRRALPYRGRRPSPRCDGVALHVAPGETVALVGATGAGKSTLVKLLARFYDVDVGGGARRRGRRARGSGSPTTATGSASCRRRRTCSPATWPPTSPTAGPTPHRPRSRPRPARWARCELVARPARRLPPSRRRARAGPVGGPAPAHRAGPRRAGRPRRAAVRRGHRGPRPRHRGRGARRGRSGHGPPHRVRRRPPARHRRAGRPHRRPRGRPDRRAGHPRRAARRGRASTPGCGRRGSSSPRPESGQAVGPSEAYSRGSTSTNQLLEMSRITASTP